MMELRLRKLIAEIQANYWMESKASYGLHDEEVSGRDLASQHTAEEALHLQSFLRTSGNYNPLKLFTKQFCAYHHILHVDTCFFLSSCYPIPPKNPIEVQYC